MDWDSTLEFAFLPGFDFELGLFMDQNFSGDGSVGELMATPSDNSSLVMDPFALVHDVGSNIKEPVLQPDFNYENTHQACQVIPPANNISGDKHINSDFETVNSNFETFCSGFEAVEAMAEGHGTWGVETPTATSTSSTVALSPSNSSLSMSPFNSLQYQLSEMPPINACQPEYLASSMQQAQTYQQAIPTQYPETSQPRRRRDRKHPENLKRNQRKVSKPEKCSVCGKGYAYERERDRHMVSNHRKEAERLGLDVSKTKCGRCDEEFDSIRRDRLTRHMKNKHPDFS